MKKFVILATIVLSSILFFKFSPKEDNLTFNVRICKVVEHEALNSAVSGISDYLAAQKGKKFKISVETCQGNMALASQIIAKFANSATDVVVTIGTIPSQAAYKIAKDGRIRVVFSSVTNPADICNNFSGSNMTGVSNFVKLEPQLEIFKKIQPSLQKIGMIYNTGEANSASIIKNIRPICEKMKIELIVQGISKISELPQATEKLAKSVNANFISNDNMALSGMHNIIAISEKNEIPVYVSDTDQVEKGCAAALGPNQYDIGIQTGKIVKRIADGEDINKIAVQYPDKTELYVNTKSIQKIPAEVLTQAKKIF